MKASNPREVKATIVGVGVLLVALIVFWLGSHGRDDDSTLADPATESENSEDGSRRTVSSSKPEQVTTTNSEWQSRLDDLFNTQRFPALDHQRFMTHFQGWFAFDREAATKAALRLQDESLRRLALEEGITSFSQDVGKLVDFCSHSFVDPDEKYSFAISCVEKLSPLHLEAALSLLSKEEFSEYRSDSIGAIFTTLGKLEDITFLSIVSNTTELKGKDKDLALRAALRHRKSITIDDCEMLMNHTNNSDVLVSAFKIASERIAGEAGFVSLDEKLKEVSIPEPVSRKVFEICVIQGSKSKSLEDVLELMQQSSLWEKGVNENFVAGMICSKFSLRSAQKYVSSLPDDNKNKAAVIARVASASVKEDVVSASKWIEGLPRGKTRDQALQPLLKFLQTNNDEESLADWSKLLSEVR